MYPLFLYPTLFSILNWMTLLVDINVSGEGEIIAISLEQAVGSELFAASVQINDLDLNGTGAEISAIIDQDPLSETFRKITGFEIENGGIGYNESNYSIQVIPIIRAINEGIPAEAGITSIYEYNETSQQNDYSSATIALKQNLDGSLRTGSGYVIAPRLLTPPFSSLVIDGKSYERISLSPSTTNTSSVEPFFLDGIEMLIDDAYIYGGFTQSPVILEVNASFVSEAIESVSLVIDGETSDDLTRTKPPYSFSWVPDVVKNYTISAIVRDVAGNINTTPLNFVEVSNYDGAGISLAFQGDSNYSIESNGLLPLIVEATSDAGVEVVDFFIDNQKVGSAVNDAGSLFQTVIDLEPLNLRQGDYEVTAIGRDKNGNWAGTFSNKLTNLAGRVNRKLTILPPNH